MPGPSHVIILGSGIAGPLVALAILKRTEIPRVTIIEHRPFPATIGGAVNLAPNALRVLSRLGIDSNFGAPTPSILLQNQDGVRIGEVHYGGRRPGEVSPEPSLNVKKMLKGVSPTASVVVPTSDFARGYEGTRVLRTQFHGALLDALEPYEDSGKLEIVYGAKTVDIEEAPDAVRLTFEGGSTITGDLLLGADGIHSIARDWLHRDLPPWEKPKTIYSGVTLTYGILETDMLPRSYTAPLRTHKTIGTLSREAGLFTVSSASNSLSHIYWFASRCPRIIPSTDEEEERPATIRRELLEAYGQFPPPIPEVLRATQKIAYWPVYKLVPPPSRWHSEGGRVVLLGDACHPMPPFAAQGVGMAVEDGAMIANILAAIGTYDNGDVSGKIWEREYQGRRESRVRAFVTKAESMSSENGVRYDGWVDDPEAFKEWATWALLPAMSWAGSEKDVQGWAYDVDEDAVQLEDLLGDVASSPESQPASPAPRRSKS